MAAMASFTTPALVHAQANQGSIGIALTILPAPLTLVPTRVMVSTGRGGSAVLHIDSTSPAAGGTITPFVRITGEDSADADRPFIATPRDAALLLRLPALPQGRLRLERLITAGT